MDDYISRKMAIEELNRQIRLCDKALADVNISSQDIYAVSVERASLNVYKERLKDFPAASVRELKRGKWINDRGVYKCSSCGELWVHWWAAVVPPEKMAMRMRWCPMCGADMRGEG